MKHHSCHPPSKFDMLLFSILIKLLNLHILIFNVLPTFYLTLYIRKALENFIAASNCLLETCWYSEL